MSQDFTINPKQTVELDKAVAEVKVHVGTALVSLPGSESKPAFIDTGETLDCENKTPAVIYSPDSANVSVTYTEEVEAPAPAERGDTGGTGGSFESRTVKELRAEAKDRGLKVNSKATKAELIAALREG